MKKTYVTPDVEILDFAETKCHYEKEILSSTGVVIGTETVELSMPAFNFNNYYGGNNHGSSHKKKAQWWEVWGYWHW